MQVILAMNDVNKGNAVDDDVDSVDNVKEKPTGSSVALVALANPLLDMLISVEDDSLVTIADPNNPDPPNLNK